MNNRWKEHLLYIKIKSNMDLKIIILYI